MARIAKDARVMVVREPPGQGMVATAVGMEIRGRVLGPARLIREEQPQEIDALPRIRRDHSNN